MSDMKQQISQQSQLETAPIKKSKRGSCARSCKRFWWVYLIASIIAIVLAVVICIFAVVPKVAQNKVNEAELEIEGVHILETESNAFLMEINSTITTKGGIKATVDAFEGDMYLEDYEPHVPFVRLSFPKTNNNKHQVVNTSQHIEIADMDAFTRYNVWFHNNETLRVTLKGKTKVQPNGLDRKSSVNFKKTLEIKGLNVFAGTEVTEGHIGLQKDANGKNFNGTAKIPNASHFTLDIGNCTFINYIDDEEVGTLYIDNLLLVPGDNVVPITAVMDQVGIIQTLQKRPYCETGIIPFKMLGSSVVNHGQDLSYFATALGSVNQTVNINIGAIVEKDLGAKIACKD